MNARVVSIVAAKELRDLIRDRRTIISMILIPILSLPLLMSGVVWMASRSLEKMRSVQVEVAVRGESAFGLLDSLQAPGGRFAFHADLRPELPVDSALAGGGADIVLEFGHGLDAALERLDDPASLEEAPAVRLYFDSTDDDANMAGRELLQNLTALREGRLRHWLGERSLRPDLSTPWLVEHVETAPPKRQAAEMVARILPYLILILCIQGAMYPAMDLTAGEKERSTIETLLVNPISRLDVVMGKYVATSAMALGSALFTLGGQYAYLRLAANRLVEGGLPIHIEPAALALGLLLLLPVALLFSALMLAVCVYARSMKEAQSYMGPLLFVVIFPSMASMIPGLELNLGLAFVPVFNVTLLMRDVLMQDFSQAGMMAAVCAINLGYAALSLWAAVKMFQREEIIFRS